jgi:hypothetical protein
VFLDGPKSRMEREESWTPAAERRAFHGVTNTSSRAERRSARAVSARSMAGSSSPVFSTRSPTPP